MPDIRQKACGYLRDGKVTLLKADFREGPRQPYEVMAHVEGHRSVRMVRLDNGRWTCTCREPGCPHVAAVQLVTGHPSNAAKPGKETAA